MARNDTLRRTLQIMHFLQISRLGLSAKEILEKLQGEGIETSKRTIYRDLEVLQDAKFNIIKDERGDQSVYKLGKISTVSGNISFTYNEILALYVARNSFSHFNGTPLFDELDSVFKKIEKIVGTQCEAFDEFEETMGFQPKMSWQSIVPPVLLDSVHAALSEGHPLEVEYVSQSGEHKGVLKKRLIGPECLYFADGGIYLIAKDLKSEKVKTYSLTRMQSAVMMTDQEYNRSGIAAEDYFKDSFGVLNDGELLDVDILLTGPIGKYVSERRWHESQITTEEHDGIHLKFNIRINDEFARWVLSLGPQAQVLKPARLQARIRTLAKEVLTKYSDAA